MKYSVKILKEVQRNGDRYFRYVIMDGEQVVYAHDYAYLSESQASTAGYKRLDRIESITATN